jgi:hypothetical protein
LGRGAIESRAKAFLPCRLAESIILGTLERPG